MKKYNFKIVRYNNHIKVDARKIINKFYKNIL